MKRVLNSGTVKLPLVTGVERDLLSNHSVVMPDPKELMPFAFEIGVYKHIKFKFEIKAPLLTFLTFQDSNLGTLNRLPKLDHPIAYLPPQFYKKDDTTYIGLDPKSCNVYNTKLYNFYAAALNFYNKLKDEGMCEEQARLVLPQGMLINFLWEVTAADLIKFVETFYHVSPELYGYCSTLALYLDEHTPEAAKWLKQNRWKNISL